jgi:serine/threonine protein kinase
LNGQVKLLDFGIARTEASPHLTATGDVIGTLQYLSPEQLKGGMADSRSDIWALGVLFYEMLTGQVPFDSPTIGSLCEKICKVSYAPASALIPKIPREADAIISKCLKKNPADRYQSASMMRQDILKLMQTTSLPVMHSPGQPPAEAVRTGQGVKVAGILAAVVAFIGIVIGLAWILSGLKPDPVPVKPTPQPLTQTNQNMRIIQSSNTSIQPATGHSGKSRMLTINSTEGKADVYRGGVLVGSTPYLLEAQVGERIDLVIKKPGYVDKPVFFEVSENRKEFTFSLQKIQ